MIKPIERMKEKLLKIPANELLPYASSNEAWIRLLVEYMSFTVSCGCVFSAESRGAAGISFFVFSVTLLAYFIPESKRKRIIEYRILYCFLILILTGILVWSVLLIGGLSMGVSRYYVMFFMVLSVMLVRTAETIFFYMSFNKPELYHFSDLDNGSPSVDRDIEPVQLQDDVISEPDMENETIRYIDMAGGKKKLQETKPGTGKSQTFGNKEEKSQEIDTIVQRFAEHGEDLGLGAYYEGGNAERGGDNNANNA